ncbi:unnamed protein product [Colias eurytheme]|nr:unnamed protein product [Colias eurytheme]
MNCRRKDISACRSRETSGDPSGVASAPERPERLRGGSGPCTYSNAGPAQPATTIALRLLYWNARSIVPAHKKPLLRHLMREQNIDAVLLNETQLGPSSKLSASGYVVYRRDEDYILIQPFLIFIYQQVHQIHNYRML